MKTGKANIDQVVSELSAVHRIGDSRRDVLRKLGMGGAGVGLLSLASGVLAQASPESSAELTIHLQAGLDKILTKHANPLFARSHPGVKLVYDAGTNARAYPKMLTQRAKPSTAGGTFNDVYSVRGIEDKMWAPFDMRLIPNARNIPAPLMAAGRGFGIPVHLCPYGIMYNPDRVPEPKSWADLWDPKYKQKVGMYATYFDAYIMAAKAAGKEPTVENGIAAWAPHKANIGAWNTSVTVEQDMVSRGEIWMAPHWGAWAESARAQGKNLAFTIPKEGATQWTDYLQLSAGLDPKVAELATQFFNVLLSDEVQTAWITDGFLSPVTTTTTIPAAFRQNKAILTAEEAKSRLFRADYAHIGTRTNQIEAMVNQMLKS